MVEYDLAMVCTDSLMNSYFEFLHGAERFTLYGTVDQLLQRDDNLDIVVFTTGTNDTRYLHIELEDHVRRVKDKFGDPTIIHYDFEEIHRITPKIEGVVDLLKVEAGQDYPGIIKAHKTRLRE